jgi:hypothetical protein
MTTAFDFIALNSCLSITKSARPDQSKNLARSQSGRRRLDWFQTRGDKAHSGSPAVMPAYDVRNGFQRPLEASVCGRVAGGVRALHGLLLSSFGHENHADVYVFVWMAGKCVS